MAGGRKEESYGDNMQVQDISPYYLCHVNTDILLWTDLYALVVVRWGVSKTCTFQVMLYLNISC